MNIFCLSFVTILFLLTSTKGQSNHLGLKKCCARNQVFDAKYLSCVSKPSDIDTENVILLPDQLIEKETLSSYSSHNISNDDLAIKLIKCHKKKVLQMGDQVYSVTNSGELISLTGAYEASVDLGDFCLGVAIGDDNVVSRVAVVCDPCDGAVCINSCCPPSKTYNDGVCEEDPSVGLVSSSLAKKQGFLLVYDGEVPIVCPRNFKNPSGLIFPAPDNVTYKLFEDGTLELTFDGQEEKAPVGQYCVGYKKVIGGNGETSKEPVFDFCIQDEVCISCILYPICTTISNIFLVLTLTAYILLPCLHGPLFGKVVMAFVVALFAAYLTMTINAFGGPSFTAFDPIEVSEEAISGNETEVNPSDGINPGCKFLGFLIQFCFLHAFFWMNVVAYDIFQKFCKNQSTGREMASGGSISMNKKRLALYTLYAVGIPLIISIITVIVEFVESDNIPHYVKPYFGEKKCFFEQKLSALIFFYLPLLIIQLTNIGFFVTTILKLHNSWSQSKSANLRIHNVPKSKREHFKIGAKLFLIMGITWFFEFFSFLADWLWDPRQTQIISYINDCINLLQGVFIFILLICKKSIFRKLKQRITTGHADPPPEHVVSNRFKSSADDSSTDRKPSVSTSVRSSSLTPSISPENERRLSLELNQLAPADKNA